MIDFVAGIVSCLVALILAAGGTALSRYLKNRRSGKIRMLARQYRAMTDSASRDVPVDVLARPELISSRMEFRKIEAIEAELMNEKDKFLARKLLNDFFAMDDPWVRARAAKALYPLDPKAALDELAKLVKSRSPYVQLPGIWALGRLPSERGLQLLISLVSNKEPEIQQAVLRCLVELETHHKIPATAQAKVQELIKEVRFKMDWIL